MLSSPFFNYVFMYSFFICILLLASTARGASPGGPGGRAGRAGGPGRVFFLSSSQKEHV